MAVYAISDMHSDYTLLMKRLPPSFEKLILLGDNINKGYEQEEMLEFLLKAAYDNKYVLVYGNHEVRVAAELYAHAKENKIFQKIQNSNLMKYLHKIYTRIRRIQPRHINFTNLLIRKLEGQEIEEQEILNLLSKFIWYYKYKAKSGITWILSHASWVPYSSNKTDYEKANLLYDKINLLTKVRQKELGGMIKKYVMYCKATNIKHVFGHFPTQYVAGKDAPVIFHDVFYYIDNGITRTAVPYFQRLF